LFVILFKNYYFFVFFSISPHQRPNGRLSTLEVYINQYVYAMKYTWMNALEG